MLLFVIFSQFASSNHVLHLNYESLMNISQTGWTYVMAASSDTYEYPKMVKMFTRASHLSSIENANFVVLDVAAEQIEVEQLNVTQFPSLIFIRDGHIEGNQHRSLDEETIVAFMNTNGITSPPIIETEEQLQSVYSSFAPTLIAALPDASDETLPTIGKFYRNHFHDVLVYYALPELFEKPGVYLYRYLDAELIEIENGTKMTEPELTRFVQKHLVPEIPKLTSGMASFYEQHNETFVILMLVMEDFYLVAEQLEMAREIKAKTGLNVSYADLENTQLLSFRYGLPDSLDSTMAVITKSNGRILKYMLNTTLTADSAVKFIEDIRAGSVPLYWKSEIITTKPTEGPVAISANHLLDLIRTQKSFAMTVYYGRTDYELEPFINATALIQQTTKDVVFGKFSLGRNDWPLEEFDLSQLPHLFVFVKGKQVFEGLQANTTEACALQLSDSFGQNEL